MECKIRHGVGRRMNQQIRSKRMIFGIVVIVAFVSIRMGQNRGYIDFAGSLNRTAVTVDGHILKLSDIAFYIAYEEQQVEKDALVYNPKDTGEYWKIHSNGMFIRIAAKNAALDMAVHDEIFYQMALADGTKLNQEEQLCLTNDQYDFWSDLNEEQRRALGVSQETLNQSMEKIALAQKYQSLYADMHQTAYEQYLFNGDAYQKLLEEHKVKTNDKIWDRVHFGSITVDH